MTTRASSRPGRKDLRALFWASIGTFVGTALATYYPDDPSLNTRGKIELTQNAVGVVGSFLSDALYQGLGLAAWGLVLYCLRKTYLVWNGEESRQSVWLRSALALAFISVLSGLLALHFGIRPTAFREVSPGGLLGTLVSQVLQVGLNPVGVGILLWSLLGGIILAQRQEIRPNLSFRFHRRAYIDLVKPLWSLATICARAFGWFFRLLRRGAAAAIVWIFEPSDDSNSDRSGEQVRDLEMGLSRDDTASKEPVFGSNIQQTAPGQRDEGSQSEPVQEASKSMPLGLEQRRRPVRMQAKINRTVENWKLPDLALLEDPPASRIRIDKKEIEAKAQTIVDKLQKFNVGGEVVAAKPGPAVTLFEFRPNADVQLTQVTSRADDLALALAAESLRIIAPIPGRDVVGIETSNASRETVYLKDILADQKFWKADTPLPICMGREVDGTPRVVDLRSMPHMMVAGQTGSGKSVFVVSSIVGFIFRHSPKTLRVVLIDPKQVDLTLFNQIPHLLMPPICEAKKAVQALRWGVREMEKRNRSFNRFKVRKLEEFNEAVKKLTREQIEEHAAINAELEANNRRTEQYYYQELPFIVYVIEEFGDLMMVDKNHVEEGVVRLTQMARAAGIHLILAMQTPRKEIVTGRIKTNIPGRVSFKVPGLLDSKIILDEKGAERLLGKGDLLFLAPGVSKPQRHHAPWLTNEEIERVVSHWSAQGEPQYDELAMRSLEGHQSNSDSGSGIEPSGAGLDFDDDSGGDEMYDQILAWVATQRTVSASLIQRKFGLGYPRASRLIDQFERAGVIGPNNGSKPRQVLVQPMPSP